MHLRGNCEDCLSLHGDKQFLVYKLYFVVIYRFLSAQRQHDSLLQPGRRKHGQQVISPESWPLNYIYKGMGYDSSDTAVI